MRSRTWKPSSRPCLQGHGVDTYAEFERMCSNIRPRPGEDLLVGECRRCGSTIAWKIHPTRFDEPEENPMRERSERTKGGRRNPQMGTHPDLFEGSSPIFVPLEDVPADKLLALPRRAFNSDEWDSLQTKQQEAIITNRSMTLGELQEEGFWDGLWISVRQALLGKTPRSEFVGKNHRGEVETTDEWNSLSDDDKEWLIEHNDESQELIEAVVKPFKERYSDSMDPAESYILESVGTDGLHSWLQEQADHLVALARMNHDSDINEIIDNYTDYSHEQVEQAIDEAMRDIDNYDAEVGDEYERAFFKDSTSTGYFSIDVREVWDETSQMSDEELEEAAKQINRATDDILKHGRKGVAEYLRDKRHAFERDIENTVYVDFDPNWEKISAQVDTLLADIEPEGEGGAVERERPPEKPLEDRVVHRWKDGFQIVELLPREYLPEGAPYECPEHGPFYPKSGDFYGSAKTTLCPVCGKESPRSEGSLFMCIGSPAQRFVGTARKGAGRAWSLRTASGKRKIAIFADLQPDGSIRRIDQAKGYRNRLPGFEASVAGGQGREGKFKPDEVLKVAEFIASLGVDPYSVGDLSPGMKMAREKAGEGNQEAKKVEKTLEHVSPSFLGDKVEKWTIAEVNPHHPARVCRTCGGEAGGFCA